MLASILGDPESMQQIKELAQMLSEQTNGDDLSGNGSASEDHPNDESEFNQNAADPASQSSFDPSALSGLAGLFGSGGIDLNTIMGIGRVLSAAGGDDKNTALLLALKPHLSEVRQQKVDRAVKMLKIYALILALKDSGMLGQII
ncbi:MAG: hypothetical protein K2K57_13310 [Oscillospiraceae bacterium]|nr:hypothetical protein [Oscillospiraceae bacterium]